MTSSKLGSESNGILGPLVVLFHGYTNRPKDMERIEALVLNQLPRPHIIKPEIPLSRWSTADARHVVSSLLEKITKEWNAQGDRDIIFIGHSVGGLLARKVYVAACGPTKDAPFSDVSNITGPQPWAARVKRIILLAGMNRGWEISYHFSAKNAIIWTVGVWIANAIEFLSGRRPLMLNMRRGARFLTQLRLQWLAMKKHAASRGMGGALTVQLLGSIDDVVSPEDNIDLISGRDFIYLDVPNTGHNDIINVDPNYIKKEDEKEDRSGILVDALTLSRKKLEERAAEISDQPLPEQNPKVKDVIFVVHGIRDVGFWTQKIARRVVARAKMHKNSDSSPDSSTGAVMPQTDSTGDATQVSHQEYQDRVFAMETASYGYFPMAPFLFASRRRQKVEWLMNQYAEAMATYPNAEFSCIAHSNGTYLVAKALEEYPACRFKRIVFAGSVVRQNLNWEQYIKSKRVEAVLNYVATGDWVVAFFPKLFEILRIQDLGSAGFDGFIGPKLPWLHQVEYVKGGHGAALTEKHWDDIADFIVKPVGQSSPLPQPLPQPEGFTSGDKKFHPYPQSWWMKIVGQFPLLVWGLILAILTGIGWSIVRVSPNKTIRTGALLLYVKLIWEILTRV